MAAAAPAAEQARTPVGTLAGTWAWQDLDEALSADGSSVSVRIAISQGRPVLVFPGQRPVKAGWQPGSRRLVVTARRALADRSGTVTVRYVLRMTTAGGRTRMAGRLVIRRRDLPGSSAVTALLTARPV